MSGFALLRSAHRKDQNDTARILVALTSIFLAFAFFKARSYFPRLSATLECEPVRWRVLGFHAGALFLFGAISRIPTSWLPTASLSPLWWTAGVVALVLAVISFLPVKWCLEFIRGTGYSGLYALGAGLLAWRLGDLFSTLWEMSFWRPFAAMTFGVVKILLGLFVSDVRQRPRAFYFGKQAIPCDGGGTLFGARRHGPDPRVW